MKNKEYIDISKAFSSSLVEKVGASTTFNSFVPINKIAELKGLKSNRSLRLAIQKGKYIAREVKVFGGKSYEILYSSLEPEIQRILRGVAAKRTPIASNPVEGCEPAIIQDKILQDELIKEATQSNCTALVPINNINNKNFISYFFIAKFFIFVFYFNKSIYTNLEKLCR